MTAPSLNTICFTVTLVAMSLAQPAIAQSQSEVRKACRSDVMRLCLSAARDRDKLRSCMRDNRQSLSQGCHTALAAAQAKQEGQKGD